jgi:FkbM family methyltransferase
MPTEADVRSRAIPIGDMLSKRSLSGFQDLLAAYRKAGYELENAVDGGAGAGGTAKGMLPHLTGDVYAFEPFPGNHRFFDDLDPRIRLSPCALAEAPKTQSFRIRSVVTPDSAWGKRGRTGYSATGRLVGEAQEGDYTVDCVRADDVIDEATRVDFIKLDLQGGEIDALRGMPRLLSQARFLWVEYTGRDRLFEYLADNEFRMFDTEYLFYGRPTPAAKKHFRVSQPSITLTTGRTAWEGFRKTPWADYAAEFQRHREASGVVQTDLVCVKKDRTAEFKRAVQCLE